MRSMDIELIVRVNGQFLSVGYAMKVPEQFEQTFEPLCTCDDALIAYATGDKLAGSQEVNIIMKTRDDAADVIAKALAELLVNAMKKHDSHNGYKA